MSDYRAKATLSVSRAEMTAFVEQYGDVTVEARLLELMRDGRMLDVRRPSVRLEEGRALLTPVVVEFELPPQGTDGFRRATIRALDVVERTWGAATGWRSIVSDLLVERRG